MENYNHINAGMARKLTNKAVEERNSEEINK